MMPHSQDTVRLTDRRGVQGGAGAEATTMGFGCAREDAGATLALFSEVIRSPALAQPKVDLYKAQVISWVFHWRRNRTAAMRMKRRMQVHAGGQPI